MGCKTVTLSIVAWLMVLPLIFWGGAFQNLEFWVYEQMLTARPVAAHAPPVTLITISDEDLIQLQRSSLPDSVLFDVLQILLNGQPRGIGVDLYRDIPMPPGTKQLANLLNHQPAIIVAQKYGDEHSAGIAPPAYLQYLEQAGCTDFPIDNDNRVRRALIYMGNAQGCYSFAYLLVLHYLAPIGITALADANEPETLRLGKVSLPRLQANDGGYRDMDSQGYQILLDYRYPPAVFQRYTLQEALHGWIPAADIAEKIVLIGSIAESSKDFFSIPVLTPGSDGQKTAGVEVHALLIDQLIRTALDEQQSVRPIPEWLEWLWGWVCCLIGVLVGSRKLPLPVFVLWLLLGLLGNAAAVFALFNAGRWMPFIPSVLGWFFSATLTVAWLANQEFRQRQVLMSLFARHVSTAIADEIWQHRNVILSGGKITPQRMTATVFFSDIAGFTSIAERLPPDVFYTWLNEYLQAVTTVISQHNGVVIRFIGDAILAGFGVPIPRNSDNLIAEDAIHAARCALAIQNELIQLNRNWSSRNLPVVTMRIGLNTGCLLAGSLGSQDRLEYSIQGDTVNTSARLESYQNSELTTDFFSAPCRILISADTAQYLNSAFSCVPLGNISFKGKDNSIEVFRLL